MDLPREDEQDLVCVTGAPLAYPDKPGEVLNRWPSRSCLVCRYCSLLALGAISRGTRSTAIPLSIKACTLSGLLVSRRARDTERLRTKWL
jgi:hypothetical protein